MHLHESRIITHLLKLISDVKDNFIMCVIEKMEKKKKQEMCPKISISLTISR